MEPWSDQPIHVNFKITFNLDTNILAYLVDETFSGLNSVIKVLADSKFAELKSSRYVIFEYVGIRKREHYLRKLLEKTNPASGKVNLSSLLQYKGEGFNSQHVPFKATMAEIEKTVLTDELNKLINDYDIDYNSSDLHLGLWKPTYELLLCSRLSREDSLVVMSSVSPSITNKEPMAYLLTNDERFKTGFDSPDQSAEIDAVFQRNNLNKPEIIHIDKIECGDGRRVNLTVQTDDARAPEIVKQKLLECILKKNASGYLGKTLPCPRQAPTNAICFTLAPNTVLPAGKFLVFLGKDLDFIYSAKVRVNEFRDQNVVVAHPYSSPDEKNLAFLLNTLDANNAPVPENASIIARLRETGNLVFIHPDDL